MSSIEHSSRSTTSSNIPASTSIIKSNPYDALIDASHNDSAKIQTKYENHRQGRNEAEKAKLLSLDFKGMDLDPILCKLMNKVNFPEFKDPRHCLVFWARPTQVVKALVKSIQVILQEAAPNLWLMPQDNLHMTALEITHSKTEPDIASNVRLLASKLEEITDFTFTHRTRLIRPLVSYDAAALALSFIPAAEPKVDGKPTYTYHHLRRDLYKLCDSTGVEVGSRYVVPSAHVTIARFVTQQDTSNLTSEGWAVNGAKLQSLISQIESINAWLKEEIWPNDGAGVDGGNWVVGSEKGLDCCRGTLWFGDGERVHLGRGF